MMIFIPIIIIIIMTTIHFACARVRARARPTEPSEILFQKRCESGAEIVGCQRCESLWAGPCIGIGAL